MTVMRALVASVLIMSVMTYLTLPDQQPPFIVVMCVRLADEYPD